jgi:hypothetical protein
MKKNLSIIFLLLIGHLLIGQNCSGPDHSINVNDSWLSCAKSQSPNPLRGESHWILYDLGYEYELGATHFWNYNVGGDSDNGMKTISIDYSLDGFTWIELEIFELQEATSMIGYEGETGADFGSQKCRYVLITGLDSWGGSCVGLSEVRFDLEQTSSIQSDVIVDHSGITLFPNPTQGFFTISGLVDLYNIEIVDVNGSILQNHSNASSPISIDISMLPSGLYFVHIERIGNPILCMKKIIKQ